ncbi:hypothetical protein SETIT_5G446700v2 [Setaria italica]|uniref:Uncharacterized protein n=1 Tax=Setaria italica TaxID=4555 RepID=K3XM57_SETIT|nr:uncharacterized protein LOC101784885 [Setaria italica]RCV28980.1 hypothetical protein SETIT_5G446700v2 [Setaria italica]
MPAGGSSYLAPMPMTGRRSFAYHKLKKLPPAPAPPTATTLEHQDQQQQPPPPSAAAIQESYQSYYLALGAAVARARRRRQRPRRVRPRLRISGLARALRRGAAAAGARVRASVAKVARRLREGRPYIGDLFAGNYMFLQVAPSPTMVAGVDDKQRGFAPFTQYYYAKVGAKSIMPPPPAAGRALQVHQPAAAARVMYKV